MRFILIETFNLCHFRHFRIFLFSLIHSIHLLSDPRDPVEPNTQKHLYTWTCWCFFFLFVIVVAIRRCRFATDADSLIVVILDNNATYLQYHFSFRARIPFHHSHNSPFFLDKRLSKPTMSRRTTDNLTEYVFG